MGLFKRIKKAAKRIGGKSVMRVVKPVKSFFKGPDDKPEADTTPEAGTRKVAAQRLQQAGSGQIRFNTEETV
jgi:hypothetical protein